MQLLVSISGENEQHTVTLEGIAPGLTGLIVIECCYWCGEQFLCNSPHQKFCKDTCRKTSFRKNGKNAGLSRNVIER